MPIGECSFTGVPINDTGDGIWDDGEWISWDYINQLQFQQELCSEFDPGKAPLVEIFYALVETAIEYKERTNRHLDIFGELGEFYAEIKLGLVRHKPNASGSDGRMGDDFVEVKTISPVKQRDNVRVKRKGHFNKLYVVRISEDYEFEGRMLDRRDLRKGRSKFASVSFAELAPEGE
jgi:hypothetical protein